MNNNFGLVLEGGGMRGVFTTGVLDYFMDRDIRFPYTIAVSAGACNGLSYASAQRGRAKISNIELLDKYHYIGIKHLFRQRNIMDFDFIFNELPARIIPYDYDRYFNSPERFVIVTSNCQSGQAEYFEEKSDPRRLMDICRASCSLPFVCSIMYVDGIPMLDGGICDAIPIRQAVTDGYEKNVIVLTRNKGYRKNDKKTRLPWFAYRKFPAIREQLRQKNHRYNETLEYIEQLEQEEKAIIIRPEIALTVDRMERDIHKLADLYRQGYECARKIIGNHSEFRPMTAELHDTPHLFQQPVIQ